MLPTGGVARTRGGLSVSDFVKCISVQEVSREGFARLAPVVAGIRARRKAWTRTAAPSRCASEAGRFRSGGRSRECAPINPPLEGRTDKLRLDFNENPIGCSPAVRRALAKLSAAAISAYPEQETVRRKGGEDLRRSSPRNCCSRTARTKRSA